MDIKMTISFLFFLPTPTVLKIQILVASCKALAANSDCMMGGFQANDEGCVVAGTSEGSTQQFYAVLASGRCWDVSVVHFRLTSSCVFFAGTAQVALSSFAKATSRIILSCLNAPWSSATRWKRQDWSSNKLETSGTVLVQSFS